MSDVWQIARNRGEREPKNELVEQSLRHRSWIHAYIKRQMGPLLHRHETPEDLFQELLVRALAYVPHHEPTTPDGWRGLLKAIAENLMESKRRWYLASCRDVIKEESWDNRRSKGTEATKGLPVDDDCEMIEIRRAVWRGVQELETALRDVVLLRVWKGLTFVAIAKRLNVTAFVARNRYRFATERLYRELGSVA